MIWRAVWTLFSAVASAREDYRTFRREWNAWAARSAAVEERRREQECDHDLTGEHPA